MVKEGCVCDNDNDDEGDDDAYRIASITSTANTTPARALVSAVARCLALN
jgi:hypothetical protein